MDIGFDNNILGERIKSLRYRNEIIQQKDFAQMLGIPQPTLSAYETGRIKPTADMLISIANKCGVSIDWLCGRDDRFNLRNMGDMLSFFLEMYESNEFSIETNVSDDNIELRVYQDESREDPKAYLSQALCDAIKTSYELTNGLRRYELSQENYEREKAHFIREMRKYPLSKVNHSGLSEDERRKEMQKIISRELESTKMAHA